MDVTHLARNVAQVIEPKAAREHIAFTATIPDDLGEAVLDTANLSAALVNILENAIDACLADTAKDSHAITFSVTATDAAVVFDITDNGMGMDQETREKAFTLFFSSKGLKGTGLWAFYRPRRGEKNTTAASIWPRSPERAPVSTSACLGGLSRPA